MSIRASMGAMKSSTICQGTQEESHPLVLQVLARQTLVRAVEPAGVCELTPPSLGHSSWKILTWVNTHRWESLHRNPGFYRSSSIPLEQKIYTSLDASEWIRGTLPASPLPMRQHILEKEEVGDTSYGGKGWAVSEHSNPLAVGLLLKKSYSCPQHPE